jgi:hypothetical protein
MSVPHSLPGSSCRRESLQVQLCDKQFSLHQALQVMSVHNRDKDHKCKTWGFHSSEDSS